MVANKLRLRGFRTASKTSPDDGGWRPVLCWLLCPLLVGGMAVGCLSRGERQVVVYAALDEDFSAPIFAEFTRETGIVVRAKYDTESTKTVQLTTEILAERARPRCDLFWNNEILNTLRLADEGLLRAYEPPTADDYPAEFRDREGRWHGFAARARVLIVNTHLVAEDALPHSIAELAEPRWRGQVALAKPLFGTTRTHAVCLFQTWGEQRARQFFRDVAGNAQILSGNKQVAVAVARGQAAWGVTDTDDAIIELEKGLPVQIIYPDQGAGEMGTLFIPNTLAAIQGSPHQLEANRLIDYLLTPAIEEQLAAGPGAHVPLHPAVQMALRVETPRTIRPLRVDFPAAAKQWGEISKFLEQTFARP